MSIKHRLQLFDSRNQKGTSQIAEFVPVLYILFLLTLAPVLDLSSAFVAGTVQYLATNDIAAKVATQSDFGNALNTMTNEAYQFQTNGLARFVHLAPAGGYVGCGDDMYVLITNVASGAVSSSNANQGLSQSIDTTNTMYEICIKSEYSVEPLINLSSLPVLGLIPGLGQPMQLSFAASRPVEHPGGLQLVNNANSGTGGAVQSFQRISAGSGSTNPAITSSTWRTPNIYQMIQAAGQTIVAQNVVVVEGNNQNWTSAGVSVSPGEMVYVDTQAVGEWDIEPSAPYCNSDANGLPLTPGDTDQYELNTNLNPGTLDGKIGSTGAAFLLGDDQYNLALPGTGTLYMVMNDVPGEYINNTGAQYVRVLVVR